jgi:hypothetical protein
MLPFLVIIDRKLGMPNSGFSAGYLTDHEASHLMSEAMPGAVVMHLKRDIPGEIAAGRRHIGELIRRAGALESQPAHVDATGNL